MGSLKKKPEIQSKFRISENFVGNCIQNEIFNEFLWKSSFLSQHYKFSQQMMIWSTKSQQKSTKSQHTHNTSKCTEFDGGSEFSQQMMIWSTKSQQMWIYT